MNPAATVDRTAEATDYACGERAAAADIAARNGPAVVGRSDDPAFVRGVARLTTGSEFDLGYLAEARRHGAIK